jgi:hypothetical protein
VTGLAKTGTAVLALLLAGRACSPALFTLHPQAPAGCWLVRFWPTPRAPPGATSHYATLSPPIAAQTRIQVTTKVMDEESGGGVLVPALGESWGQASSTRVVLFWEGAQRYAHLLKASMVPEGGAAGPASAAAAAAERRQGGQRQRAPQQGRGPHGIKAVSFDITAEGVRSAAMTGAAATAPAGQLGGERAFDGSGDAGRAWQGPLHGQQQ